MTTPRAWRRRLDFRFEEVTHYLPLAAWEDPNRGPADTWAEDAAVGHARALWRIALRMTAADRADVLDLMRRV